VLLLSVPLLALLLWQWQQLGQAIVLLTRSPASLESIGPLSPQQLQEQRLCLGLPLLLWSPLVADPPRGAAVAAVAAPAVEVQQPPQGQPELEPKPVSSSAVTDLDVTDLGLSVDVGVDVGITVEPEQASKDQQGCDLDQQIG
jgi:hypothetical protein